MNLKSTLKESKNKNGGFTLVELIIVIAILAVLGSIAVPNLIGYVEKSRAAADEANARIIADAATMYIAEKGKLSADVNYFSIDAKAPSPSTPAEKIENYVLDKFNGNYPKIKSKKFNNGGDKIFRLKVMKDGKIYVRGATSAAPVIVER